MKFLIDKVRYLSDGGFIFLSIIQKYILLATTIFVGLLFIGHGNESLFLLCLFLMLVGLSLFVNRIVHRGMDAILLESLDIVRYERHLNSYYSELLGKSFLKNLQQIYLFKYAYVLFLKGDFQQSLLYLQKVRIFDMRKKHRLSYLEKITELSEMNHVFLNYIDHPNQIQNVQSRIIYDLLHQEIPNDLLDKLVAYNALDKLQNTYYQALNAQAKGDKEKAKELFEGISSYSEEFFMVREAQKYLKEL